MENEMYLAYFLNIVTEELFVSSKPEDNKTGKDWKQISYEHYLEIRVSNIREEKDAQITRLREALKDVIRQSKSFQEKFIAYKPETISGLHMQSFAEIAEKALAETESQ